MLYACSSCGEQNYDDTKTRDGDGVQQGEVVTTTLISTTDAIFDDEARDQSCCPISDVQYAGFWLRFVAMTIDFTILIFVSGIIFWASSDVFGDTNATISEAVLILIYWLYYALMESSVAQGTLGKMALRLKVTDLKGDRISFSRATGRYFGRSLSALIGYIGFIRAGYVENKQTLHDVMAGCLVVRK